MRAVIRRYIFMILIVSHHCPLTADRGTREWHRKRTMIERRIWLVQGSGSILSEVVRALWGRKMRVLSRRLRGQNLPVARFSSHIRILVC